MIIDISVHQGNINWDKLNPLLDFVFIRATCGINKDKNYMTNVDKCKVPFGAYCYITAGTAEAAQEQARAFVQVTKTASKNPTCFVADIEAPAQNEKTTNTVCTSFANELRAQGCDKIGIYINNHYTWAGSAISLYDFIWIPRYGKNDGNIPKSPYLPKHYCDIWQYTDKGKIEGINGDVDKDIIYGTTPLFYFTEKYPTLRLGNTGNYVKFLQESLIKKGYTFNGGADGDFGAATLNAIKKFQDDHFLEVDGIVGARTWTELFRYKNTYIISIYSLSAAEAKALKEKYPNSTIF